MELKRVKIGFVVVRLPQTPLQMIAVVGIACAANTVGNFSQTPLLTLLATSTVSISIFKRIGCRQKSLDNFAFCVLVFKLAFMFFLAKPFHHVTSFEMRSD